MLENDYDFISLQEVDHYKDYLLPNLEKKGRKYVCLDARKSSNIKWLYQGFAGLYKKKVGTNLDGSALFYRADRFNLVDHKLFE